MRMSIGTGLFLAERPTPNGLFTIPIYDIRTTIYDLSIVAIGVNTSCAGSEELRLADGFHRH
jgi:hypothetical protein